MAVVWREAHEQTTYEVRSQGRTLRLFANGVQHSEFHPDRLVTGSVWDLLWLPGFFAKPGSIKRVLILGLGGGSLVPPLRRMFSPESMLAVELDAFHLQVAKRFFSVEDFGVECHCADAVEFLNHWDGPPFDLIIEDLFAPSDRTVSRAVSATGRWFGTLSKHVSKHGVLVMNFGDWPEYRDSWTAGDTAMRGWANRFRLSTPDCHNAVMAWTRDETDASVLRERLRDHPELEKELSDGRLDYRASKIS
ncbi:MAG: hypothetical protein P1U67_08955 [Alcanivoracaceae bacterium]|nr:hypothetical protein [Alcanivoracaceae bacterium]